MTVCAGESCNELVVEYVDPLSDPEWDTLLATHPSATVFHGSGWARTLAETYRYVPKYLVAREDRRLLGLLPLMQVSSVLTGNRAVSLPFSDYCDCLDSDRISAAELWDTVRNRAAREDWRYIELRDRHFPDLEIPYSGEFHCHELLLGGGEAEVWNRLKSTTRTQIRKAGKEGVNVAFSTDEDAVRSFYRLNCVTRQRHGLPPQPYAFFDNLRSNVLSKGNGFVALATYKGTPIAGAVYLQFGRFATYKYGASLREYQHLRPNSLIMWEAIRHFALEGIPNFCFGRTEPGNDGLLQFKRGWGTREYTIRYHRYDRKKQMFLQGKPSSEGALTGIMRKTPVPILKFVGGILYRHMG